MSDSAGSDAAGALPRDELQTLARKLEQLYSLVLSAEREFHPALSPTAMLDRLMNDPDWNWLRALSGLIADIDHVLAQKEAPTQFDFAVVAAHTRGMLAGEGDLTNARFFERYRPLLQSSATLASVHGEVKALLRRAPAEAENEAERLHARHQWNMRCKQGGNAPSSRVH